jgi:hypothetical protein
MDDTEMSLKRSGSLRSLGSRKSIVSHTSKKGKMEYDSESSQCAPTVIDIDPEAQSVVVKEKRSASISESDGEGEVLVFDFDDSNQKVYVPRPGETNEDTARRLVTSGCAICLSLFEANEKITWSSNPECPHIFHSDCAMMWYLAVGRKAQKRLLRINPDMSDEDILQNLCEFPILCPCCRQKFCMEANNCDDGHDGENTTDNINNSATTIGSEEEEEDVEQQQERDIEILTTTNNNAGH